MSRQSRPRGVIQIAMVSAAALAFMTTGCATSEPNDDVEVQETVACVDEDNKVVDDDWCDDDGNGHGGGGYFVFISGSHHYGPGTYIPPAQHSRPRVAYNDSAARTSAGLPATGKVATGSRTVGNSGVGKGSTGGKSGGSSGG